MTSQMMKQMKRPRVETIAAVMVACLVLTMGCSTRRGARTQVAAAPVAASPIAATVENETTAIEVEAPAPIVATWRTRWGLVTIHDDGSGGYTHQDSTLHGKISEDGRRWSGRWEHHKTDKRTGDAVFEVSADGRLEGRYWKDPRSEGDEGFAWPGVRVSPPTPAK